MGVHTYNSSYLETEAGGSQVPGEPGQLIEIPSQKINRSADGALLRARSHLNIVKNQSVLCKWPFKKGGVNILINNLPPPLQNK